MNVLRPHVLAGDRDDLVDQPVDVVAGAGLHLDRDVAEDVGPPRLGRLGYQQRAAGGQTREQGHDRDHDDQRASGDRIPRNERHAPVDHRLGLKRAVVGGLVHSGAPSNRATLPSPTTSRRANPNWSMSWRSWVAITTAVPSR